jgi:hypothetical protein
VSEVLLGQAVDLFLVERVGAEIPGRTEADALVRQADLEARLDVLIVDLGLDE